MLKSNNLKRFFSILMTVLMLLASMPSFADDEGSVITNIFVSDFEYLAEADALYGESSTTRYLTRPSANDKYIYIQNFEGSSAPVSGNELSIASDGEYNTSLVLTQSGTQSKMLNLDVRATYVSSTQSLAIDPAANFVIETAVKITGATNEADAYIGSRAFVDSSNKEVADKGIQYVTFSRDGNLYVNHDRGLDTKTKAGTWEADTWYEIRAEYSPATKFAKVIIDGGVYENAVFYCEAMSGYGVTLPYLTFGNANSASTATSAVNMHLGYLNMITETPAKSIADFELNSHTTFNNLGANDKLSATQYKTTGWTTTSGPVSKMSVVNTDDQHDLSVKVDLTTPLSTNSSWEADFRYSFAAPYATTYSDGALVSEYSVNLQNGMKTALNYVFERKGNLNANNYGYTWFASVGFGAPRLSIKEGEWYNIIRIANFNTGYVSTYVYDLKDPSKFYKWADGDLSQSGVVNSLSLSIASDGASADNAYAYFDDLKVYTTADLAFESSYPANNATLATVDDAVSLTYNAPVTSATVEVKKGANVVDPSAYDVIYAAKSIIIEPVDGFEVDSSYTVTVKDVKDVFGNTLTDANTLTFKTPEKSFNATYDIYKFDENNVATKINKEDITVGTNIKVNFTIEGNVKFKLLHAVGVYDKTSNELLSVNFFGTTKNAETSHNISHERGLLLPIVANSYVKMFAWDSETLSPLIMPIRLDY